MNAKQGYAELTMSLAVGAGHARESKGIARRACSYSNIKGPAGGWVERA